MKATRGRILVAICVSLIGALTWAFWPERDRMFRGKPESEWIKGIEYRGGDEQTRQWQEFGPEGVEVLVRGLDKADRPWKRSYRRSYAKLPFRLARLLPSPAPIISGGPRMTIIFLLGQLGTNAAPAAPAVARALKDDDTFVRQVTIGYFTSSENETALLNQIDPILKRTILPALVDSMRHLGNSGLRINAAVALKYYPEQAEIVAPILAAALKDSAPQVRLMAAISLNQVDAAAARKAGAVSVVAAVLKERDDQVASRAASALNAFRDQPEVAVPSLIEALESTNTLVACSAIWTLESAFRSQTNAILPALRKAAQRQDNAGDWAASALKAYEPVPLKAFAPGP